MSNPRGVCRYCGQPVLWLPLANGRGMRSFWPEEHPTAEVVAGQRWSWARQRGMVELDGPDLPDVCLVAHVCAQYLASRDDRLIAAMRLDPEQAAG